MKRTLALILPAMAVFSGSAHAATLQIDFSTVAGSQAGWETLGGTGSPSGSFSGYTGLSAGNITVSLANIGFDRQYNNSASNTIDFPGTDLDEMYSDLLFRNNTSATVDVTIAGLLAGTYQITTHHLIASPNPSKFDLRVQDADNAAFGQFVGNFTTGTGDASSFNPTVITFDVVSNGTDDIILQMTSTAASTGGNTGGWFGYNGMEIAVPEPSSALLGGLGMLALLRRRR